MTDFFLELRSEEVPARMQAGARAELEKLFRKEMEAAGVALGELTVWSTPRRLALIARNLPEATAAVSEELKGPKVGAPPQALEGFLRKTGLTQDQLTERDGIYFAVTEKPGRATKEVLAEAIPAIIRAFPWPKSMRWGAASLSTESLRWVRPLSGIVALLGEELVECEIGGVRSGYATHGHRFHCPGEITIGSASDYQEKLRACHVIVDHAERQDLIRSKAREVAEAAGLTLVADEGLVIENAGLTEWPVPLLGRFDEAFLEVPPEVIQLTARTNQKYFVCTRSPAQGDRSHVPPIAASGDSAQPVEVPASAGTQDLANAFVCTANIAAADGGEAIVAGNRKVLAARLSDARFFWEQDRKKPLAQRAGKLTNVVFHEKLGTVAEKAERVAKLASWLVVEGIVKGADANEVGQAARLCKADLVTQMVLEFPELQGLMGGYYARTEIDPSGARPYSDAVADAIRDHYKPVGQGDDVPTAPVTVAVSLADKLDTLVGFLMVGEYPTGSRDPFALRRAAIAISRLVECNCLRFNVYQVIIVVMKIVAEDRVSALFELDERFRKYVGIFWPNYPEAQTSLGEIVITQRFQYPEDIEFLTEQFVVKVGFWYYLVRNSTIFMEAQKIVEFLIERIRNQSLSLGIRSDVVEATLALARGIELYSIMARSRALQAFVGTEDGTNLLAGYKRAANILKKEGYESPAQSTVIPANAGTQSGPTLGPRVRGDDDSKSGDDEVGEKPLSYTPEPAEKALIDALDLAAPTAATAVAEERFADAMAALASLRAPIDAFFESVTVNDADSDKRTARLALLARFRDAVHAVADFSKIEG